MPRPGSSLEHAQSLPCTSTPAGFRVIGTRDSTSAVHDGWWHGVTERRNAHRLILRAPDTAPHRRRAAP
ncbi:hypothetical protein [Streptomyces sp. T028]|uniref:hypothetical protein n=1 Tax=Streptomyces sp. T028 TaxID=3394379 RepID=UPI003A83E887